MEVNVRERWSTPTFLLCFAVAGFLLWQMIEPFVMVLGLALFIAVVLGPVHERLARALGGRRSLATFLSVIFTVLLVLAPTAYLVFRFIQELGPLLRDLNESLGPAGIQGLLQGRLPPSVAEWLETLPIQNLDDRFREAIGRAGAWVTGAVAAVPGIGAELFTDTFVFLATLYALFLRGPRLAEAVVDVLPMEKAYTRDLISTMGQGIRSLIAAKALTAVIQGIVGFIGFKIAGLPYAVALSVVMAFCSFVLSLIPLLGTGLVWVPASIWLFFTGHTWAAVFLLAWGFLVIGIVDNFVNPLFTQTALQLPPSVVLITIFGGLVAFGPLGALFGPLIGSLVGAFIRIWKQDFLAPPPAPPLGPETTTTAVPAGITHETLHDDGSRRIDA